MAEPQHVPPHYINVAKAVTDHVPGSLVALREERAALLEHVATLNLEIAMLESMDMMIGHHLAAEGRLRTLLTEEIPTP